MHPVSEVLGSAGGNQRIEALVPCHGLSGIRGPHLGPVSAEAPSSGTAASGSRRGVSNGKDIHKPASTLPLVGLLQKLLVTRAESRIVDIRYDRTPHLENLSGASSGHLSVPKAAPAERPFFNTLDVWCGYYLNLSLMVPPKPQFVIWQLVPPKPHTLGTLSCLDWQKACGFFGEACAGSLDARELLLCFIRRACLAVVGARAQIFGFRVLDLPGFLFVILTPDLFISQVLVSNPHGRGACNGMGHLQDQVVFHQDVANVLRGGLDRQPPIVMCGSWGWLSQ